MKLWLEAHRPKTGKLDGDPDIEREALANLETSDVFQAVTAPLRRGGGRQGELMLDEFRRGTARYGRLKHDPMAGVRFLEENVRSLRSEWLAEIYWPVDKAMPGDIQDLLYRKREDILDYISKLPSKINGDWTPGEPLPEVEDPAQTLPGRIPDGQFPPDKSGPWWKQLWPRPDGTVDDLIKPLSVKQGQTAPAQSAPSIAEEDKPLWINAPDGDGYILAGQDGKPVAGPNDEPIRYRPWDQEEERSSPLQPEIQHLSSDSRDGKSGDASEGKTAPVRNAGPEVQAEPQTGQNKQDPDSLEQLHGLGPSALPQGEEKEEGQVERDRKSPAPGKGLGGLWNTEAWRGLSVDLGGEEGSQPLYDVIIASLVFATLDGTDTSQHPLKEAIGDKLKKGEAHVDNAVIKALIHEAYQQDAIEYVHGRDITKILGASITGPGHVAVFNKRIGPNGTENIRDLGHQKYSEGVQQELDQARQILEKEKGTNNEVRKKISDALVRAKKEIDILGALAKWLMSKGIKNPKFKDGLNILGNVEKTTGLIKDIAKEADKNKKNP